MNLFFNTKEDEITYYKKHFRKIKNTDNSRYYNRKSLKNIIIKDGIEFIGMCTFKYCKNLKKIILPNSVKKIGDEAFEGCWNLEEIVFPEELEFIGKRTFYGCESLKRIVIPKNVKEIDLAAFKDCENLEEIVLPEELECIGESAFSNCKGLKRIVIPRSVEKICDRAFINCKNIEEIVLSEALKIIGEYAFTGCANIKRITIPRNVKKICDGAFENCEKLEEIVLPEELDFIGEWAFSNCKSLKRIVIPKNVKKINQNTFAICENLEIYDQETNTRFIYDINYDFDKGKSIDEIIIELCSKHNIIKEKLLLLASIRLGINSDTKLNYEYEYTSFINYCNNNLFKEHNSISNQRINNAPNDSIQNGFVPWYWMGSQYLNNQKEYDNLTNGISNFNSTLVTDEDSVLLESLGIKKDEFGYWHNGDVIPELKVEEMKRLIKNNNHINLS